MNYLLAPSHFASLPCPVRLIKKVLLVDDDSALLQAFSEVLRSAGYAVTPCASGVIAITSFWTEGPFDLLLTDFQMPGMTGIALADALTCSAPGLPVLIVSGATAAEIGLSEIGEKGWSFLSKPMNLTSLMKTVNHLCGQAASS